MLTHLLLAHGGENDFWQLFLQVPPLHPLLVNVTAGLIPAAIAFDLLGRLTRRASLASAGFWMTLLAAVVTPFTALAGWLWMGDMGHGGAAMTIHKWLGTTFAALMLCLAAWRWAERRRETRPEARPGPRPAYLAVAVLFVLTLGFQGHLGGMMSFGSMGGNEHGDSASEHHEESKIDDRTPADGWQRGIPVGNTDHADAGEGHAH